MERKQKQKKVNRQIIGVAIALFLTKLMGWGRDVVIVNTMSLSGLTDIYTNIVMIPAILFSNIGLSLLYINMPSIIDFQKDLNRRNRYFSMIFVKVMIFGIVISVLMFFFSPYILKVAVPNISAKLYNVGILLTRLAVLTFTAVLLTFMFRGILQAHGYYIQSIAASIPANLITILVIFKWPKNIKALGIAIVISWIIQFVAQIPYLIKEKYKFILKISFCSKEERLFLKQLIPVIVGNLFLPVCYLSDRWFAAALGRGVASGVSYGYVAFSTAAGIFIISVGIIIFPKLTEYCINLNLQKVKNLMRSSTILLMAFAAPFLITVALYNKDIIRLILKFSDNFSEENVTFVSDTFFIYSFAILGFIAQEIFNKIFYALKKYKFPMLLSVSFIFLNIFLNLLTYKSYGYKGIVFSTSISFFLYSVMGLIITQRIIGRYLDRRFLNSLSRLLLPVCLSSFVYIVFKLFLAKVYFLVPIAIAALIHGIFLKKQKILYLFS